MNTKTIKRIKFTLGGLFAILALCIIIKLAFGIFQFRVHIGVMDTFFVLLLVFSSLLLSSLFFQSLCSTDVMKHRLRKASLWGMFLFYLIILFQLLFASRESAYMDFSTFDFWERLKCNSNLVPFHTIRGYLNNMHYFSSYVVLTNVVGNLIAFMPFAFFLSGLSKKFQHFFFFLPSMLMGVLAVELVQGITNLGFFDIDDIILNVSGACIFYGICKLRLIQRWIQWYQ